MVEDVGSGVVARGVDVSPDALALEQLQEAFGHDVVVAAAAPAHAADEVVVAQEVLAVVASELAARLSRLTWLTGEIDPVSLPDSQAAAPGHSPTPAQMPAASLDVDRAIQTLHRAAEVVRGASDSLTPQQRRRVHDALRSIGVAVARSQPPAVGWFELRDDAMATTGAADSGGKDLARASRSVAAPARPAVLELLARGVLLPSERMQRELGISKQALSRARLVGRMFAFESAGALYYPSFYADASFERRQLEAVTKALGNLSPMAKWLFFTRPKASIGGLDPLSALTAGQLESVLAAARGACER